MGVSLEEDSPFIPFDYVSPQNQVVGPQKGGVELHGILSIGGEARFSLYNPTTQKSVWVKMNDKGAPYYVDSYDPTKQTVTVTVNGVRQQLPLSKSKDDGAGKGAARPPVNVPTTPKAPEPISEEEEDEFEEEEDDADAQRRREMSEKVYEAFKKYVAEKKAAGSS